MAQMLGATAIAQNASANVLSWSSPFSRLQIRATGSAATGWANDLVLTVQLKSRQGGSISLCTSLDLYTLSRLRDDDAGGYSIFNFGGAATANINLASQFGFGGANAYLDKDVYFDLNIQNIAAAANTYTVVMDCYEAPITRPAYLKYERVNFPASTGATEQVQNVTDSDLVWVPQTGTPWTQLRLNSPNKNTLVVQGIDALRSLMYLRDSVVATDSAGANPLYAASLPVGLQGAVMDVRGYTDLFLNYVAAQTVTKRMPLFSVLTNPGSEVYDEEVAAKIMRLFPNA